MKMNAGVDITYLIIDYNIDCNALNNFSSGIFATRLRMLKIFDQI